MANGNRKGWQRKYFIWSAASFEKKFTFGFTKIFPDICTRNIPTDIRENAPFCGSASLPSPFSLAGTKYQNQTMVIRTHYDDDDGGVDDDGVVDHGDEDDNADDQNTLCAKEERTTMRAELLLSNGSKRLHIVVIIMINVIMIR